MSETLQFFNGTGNTFYFFDVQSNATLPVKTVSELRAYAKQVCSLKTRPVDGLVFYRTGDKKVEMLIVNSDGSFAGTCGNALRCLGLALIQKNSWDGKTSLHVERLVLPFFKDDAASFEHDEKFMQANECFATLVAGEQLSSKNEANVSVKMGRAIGVRPTDVHAASGVLTSAFIQLANPHWVFVMKDDTPKWSLEDCTRFGIAAQGEWARAHGVPLSNIGMVWPTTQPNTSAVLVVYERGAGLTQCCGSGACASACMLQTLYPQQREFHFQMPGGVVKVSIEQNGELVLSGVVSTENI